MIFPNTRDACRVLAEALIHYLRSTMNETYARREWSDRNFNLLTNFAKDHDLASYPKEGMGRQGEFLWDWTAYTRDEGLLIACESEWDLDNKNQHKNPKHDFAKLLFAFCPVKLALCWVTSNEQAADFSASLSTHFKCDYRVFQPGSVYILYCIHGQTKPGENKDIVYTFQASGDPVISHEEIAFTLRDI